jgi:hypothetical protein
MITTSQSPMGRRERDELSIVIFYDYLRGTPCLY